MNYRDKKDIRVYNECPFQVNLVGQRRDYIFPPCTDVEPTMNFVDFEEIEYAHSRSKVFSIGLLTFSEEDAAGMYEALGIKDWQNKVWFNKDIEDIIMNPSYEKMQRVIEITDTITLERVRGMMVRFVNEKRDVSQNVINIINQRFRELNAGNVNTKIVIRPSDVVDNKASADEVADLKRQLAEMQKAMAEMSKNYTASRIEDETTVKSSSVDTQKKPTRKATTTKK